MVDDNKSSLQGSGLDGRTQQHQISAHLPHQTTLQSATEHNRVNPQNSVSLRHSLNNNNNNTILASQPPKLKHATSNGEEHSHPDSGIGGSNANEDSMEYSAEEVDSCEKVVEKQPRSRGSQGSKETTMSTAEDWFSDLNREVQVNNNYLDFDDDPPYYQPVSSSRRKHLLPSKQQRPHKLARTNTAASVRSSIRVVAAPNVVDENAYGGGAQANMLGEGTSDSNSDSYRSVIDDLTIKNQKLKKRLRRLEELQAEHLQTDKLFELRIHGLSSNKRQELENLLQQFTSSLHHSPSSSSANSGLTQESPVMNNLVFNPAVTQQDSAYASNSGSGTQVTPSSVHPSLSSSNSKDSGRVNGKGELTEKAKMVLVVKRLEGLFTGRRQSIQSMKRIQPSVAEAITNLPDDNDDVDNDHQQEGARESLMMEARVDGGTTQRTHELQEQPNQPDSANPTSDSGLDQRPTRQLDLDLQREQIPSQNLEYLHNLTSSSTLDPVELDGQWDGWVYLNLIINMAQLHTINVTLPFVKKAIINMSSKLELSPDGKMVRWKGGDKNTTSPDSTSQSRSDSDSKYPNSRSPIDGSLNSSRGRIKSGTISMESQDKNSSNSDSRQSSNTRSASGSGSNQRSGGQSGSHSFHYKPIFVQKASSGEDSSEQDSSSSTSFDSKSGSEGVEGAENSDGRRTRIKSRFGPIIYYENGNFCTDLSAQEVVVRDESTTPDYPYERMTNEVVGAPGKRPSLASEDKFTFLHGPKLMGSPLAKTLEQEEVSTEDEEMDGISTMSFSPRLESTLPDHPPLPVELEASGIGGVTPEDNFAINVQIKHPLLPKGIDTRLFNSRKLRTKLRGIIHRIPQSTINVFLEDEAEQKSKATSEQTGSKSSRSNSPIPAITLPSGRKYQFPVRHELVSARFIRLPPSALPPASYMFFSASSDDSSPDSDSGVNTRTSGSERSMESGGFDDSLNDMDDTDSSFKARDYLSSAIFGGGTASIKDSPGSSSFGNIALGRARAADGIRETSLAVTVGSADYLSLVNDSGEVSESLDSDEMMEDCDSEERDTNRSSDVDEQEVVGSTSRPTLKRMRSTKGSVDSLLAPRKIMV